MASKLIFSFHFSLDLALNHASLAKNLVVDFSIGFDLFKVTTTYAALITILTSKVLLGSKPIFYFDLYSNLHFPSLKRQADVVPMPCTRMVSTLMVPSPTSIIISGQSVTHTSTSVPTYVPPSSKGKTMMMDEDENLSTFIFNIGSISS